MTQTDFLAEVDKIITELHDMDFVIREKHPSIPANATIAIDLNMHTKAIDQLIVDGYLIQNPHNVKRHDFTAEGREFIRKGGYKAKFAEQEKINQLQAEQIKSVIKTNAATQTAYKSQKIYGRNTLLLVGVSALLSALTLMKEIWLSPSSAGYKETEQLLQKQVIYTDSLRRSLRRIDSTFQVVTDSLKKKT